MKTINLVFKGYWREEHKDDVPDESGIYCVHTCRRTDDTHISVGRLLYIGESDDANQRIQKHNKLSDWLDELEPGEELCYSFAPIPFADRERAEAALIFMYQPPTNEEHTTQFIYNDTEIIASGRAGTLKGKFTVHKGDKL